jgi:hypothetical protein
MPSVRRRVKLDVYDPSHPIGFPVGETTYVSLKWLRGASRYNNGATRFNDKYRIRLIMGWAADKKRGV